MRLAGVALLASTIILSAPAGLGLFSSRDVALAQSGDGVMRFAEVKDKSKTTPKAPPKGAPKKTGPKDANTSAYATMPLAERVGIQFDLAWLGYFNGLINGEFNDRAVGAVKAYQRDLRTKDTGVLAPPERASLAAASKEKQTQAGWRILDDKITGAQVGVPTRHVPNVSQGKAGMRWSSAQGQIQVETFRIREPGTTLADVLEKQKTTPANRQPEYSVVRNDFFILGGTQGLKKFYVRAEIRDIEVRGVTILYDQATAGIMDPITVVMSSAFAPFPGTGLTAIMGPAPRRKVEYGTGIVVSADGHILIDRQLADGCVVMQVAGYGDANRVAEDEGAGLALLRVYGASGFTPAPLVHEGARGPDLTLVGIPDPQSQGGGRAPSAASAKLDGDTIVPFPQIGFSGAAALDSQGRFYGMVTLKGPVVASTGPAPLPPASVVSVQAIRRFLEGQYVTPANGRGGVEAIKGSLVRVVCVRR